MRLSVITWFFLFSAGACRHVSPEKNVPGTQDIQKISIRPEQVFDLSGYAGGGGGNPYNLFDENAVVDPRYDKPPDGLLPVSNCQPTIHPAIYFHGKEGNRIVTDLRIPYTLKEIYYYDRSRTADSCWIYTGSLKKWKTVAAFVTGSVTGSNGWKKINLDEQTRFVMIRFSSYETAITEMVLYGIPGTALPPPTDFSRHKGFTQTPLDHFLGVNYIMEQEPGFLKPFHYSRLYNFALDYDNDTSRDESRVRFNILHYGYYNKEKTQYVFDIDTIQRVNQGNIWYSIRGVSKWMSDLGYTDKDRPVNRPLLNTEDPASYSRHAEMMWNLSAFFGFTKWDSNLLSLSNRPRSSGRRSMCLFENGNEEDANWVGNKYCSPFEYYAQSTADWDGDEGKLGTRFGIHSADSVSRLMMSGLTGLDTNRVKVYNFLCSNLRTDRSFIWKGGIQYHYYAQHNGRGISPESDSMRLKLSKVADFSFRTAPGVRCFLGENGYDKSPVSWQCTPLIPGLTAARSQGVMLLRSINATFFSGFDAYILYWLRDGNPENDPRVYLTSGILRGMPDGKTRVYPGWYYISTLVGCLGRYLPDQIIREEGDVWIYRYRHIDHPDSVAYFIYKPTVNGGRVRDFSLETGMVSGNQVQKISFTDDSETGKRESIPVNAGKIRFTVQEQPVLILFREPSSVK
jgi:hypothetical protein